MIQCIFFISGFFDKFRNLLVNKYVKSLGRHLATHVSGWLVAIGVVVDQGQVELIIIGLLTYIVGQAFSFLDKSESSKEKFKV